MQTYEIRVLGCKANQYDAQQIRRVLELAGLREAAPGARADVVVIHTCAVTATAMRKCRQAIRGLRAEHPGARLVVTGCLAANDLLGEMPEVNARVAAGPGWLGRFAQAVGVDPGSTPDELPIERFAGHARAFLKIQDGCDIGCSYCIVPSLRKGPRDKPLPVILEEAGQLAAHGHREIVVSGISVGLYGRNGGPSLADVMRELLEIPGVERLRLSSLHPADLMITLYKVWSSSSKIMPHIHLPLQSGSDRVLAAMRRGYTAAEFLDAVARARRVLDRPAFTTDVIVGFPGEADGDFEQTLEVCRQVGFSRIHVFPYSPRPGTTAAKLAGHVEPATVQERGRRLRALGGELAAAYHRQFVGSIVHVLVESRDASSGTCEGHAERYFTVRFPGAAELVGQIAPVRLVEAGAGGARGTLAE